MSDLTVFANNEQKLLIFLLEKLWKESPLPINAIEKYSKEYHNIPIKDIIRLAELQIKVKNKLPFSKNWLMTDKNAQQSSDCLLAAYNGSLFKDFDTIADICCGIGSDLLYLSKYCKQCLAVDTDKDILAMAEYNMHFFKRKNINYLNIKAEDFDLPVNAIFIDPDRRISNKRFIDPNELSPAFTHIAELIKKYVNVAVKLSPVFDYEDKTYNSFSFDFVSVKNELKECLLKTGDLANKNNNKKAVILPEKLIFEQKNHPLTEVSEIKKYIFEPDVSIIRAHLVNDFAYENNVFRIDENIALLTSDSLLTTRFGVSYEVIDFFPYSLKKLNNYLKANTIGVADIKTRGFSETVENFRKKIKLKGYGKVTLFIIRIASEHIVIIANRLK